MVLYGQDDWIPARQIFKKKKTHVQISINGKTLSPKKYGSKLILQIYLEDMTFAVESILPVRLLMLQKIIFLYFSTFLYSTENLR